MSLIDDARRMNRSPFVPLAGSDAAFVCWYCRLADVDVAHTPDCPILALPRIVAVLEAAEAIADHWGKVYLEDMGEYIGPLVMALRGKMPWDDDDQEPEA